MARHPKREVLTSWLEGKSLDPQVDEHISTCPICAKDLETLTLTVSNNNPEPSNSGPALLTLLQPPDDLHERMSKRLAERLQRKEDLDLIGSLLGVPRESGELFITAPVNNSDTKDPQSASSADEDE